VCSLIRYEADILGRGLDVIFCGLNPAASAVGAGHNFSNRSNRFWTVLHLAVSRTFGSQPQDERRLLEYGCGITAVVGRPTKRADEVLSEEFLKARVGFETKIRRYAPRSKSPFSEKRALVDNDRPARSRVGPARDGILQARWPGFFPIRAGLNRSFSLDALVGGVFRVSDSAARQLDEADARVDLIFDEIDRPACGGWPCP